MKQILFQVEYMKQRISSRIQCIKYVFM